MRVDSGWRIKKCATDEKRGRGSGCRRCLPCVMMEPARDGRLVVPMGSHLHALAPGRPSPEHKVHRSDMGQIRRPCERLFKAIEKIVRKHDRTSEVSRRLKTNPALA